MSDQQPIRIAIIGAGIFARDAHVPSILGLGNTFEVVAVCSRREESAKALSEKLPGKVDIYTDVTALLARQDIEAVDILLPISTMPATVEMALAAGKHVISEKPISPDVATARQLLKKKTDKVWMVGENWRYEEGIVQAAEVVKRGEIGKLVLCHFAGYGRIGPTVKYYNTGWRRDNSFPGGFLMDGGVHNVATIRMILGEIASVTAAAAQVRPDLPPTDTLCALLHFESGLIGSYNVTFAAANPWQDGLYIAGEEGAIRVWTDSLEITSNGQARKIPSKANTVQLELADFAAAIRQGTAPRATPEEGARDVAVVESMLKSAQTGRSVEVERI